MANRLPEKLTALRKHYGLSQGDLAEKLGVSVMEYMNWENGNKICTIQTLIRIADIFKVTPDELADNRKELDMPQLGSDDSIDIPFINPDLSGGENRTSAESTQLVQKPVDEGDTQVVPAGGTAAIETDENSQTKVLDTQGFQRTISNEIVDELPDAGSYPEPEKRRDPEKEKKKRKTLLISVFAVVAALALAFAVMMLSDKKGSVTNTLTDINRLSAGDRYSLYIDDSGKLNVTGTFGTAGRFTDVVQVSAYEGHALGLKKDGKVVSSDDKSPVGSWKNIVMIAAGRTHYVGLRSDGTVVCTGSEAACKVETWAKIKAVYAGNTVTVGIDEEGTAHVSGEAGDADGTKNIVSAAVGADELIFVQQDGKVLSFPISGIAPSDVSEWENVAAAAAGSRTAAGLTKDGKVISSSSDEKIQAMISQWSDIRYIAVNDGTIVAVDNKGVLHGAGTNDGQYVDGVDPTPDVEKEPDEALPSVSGITFSETTANVVIKWAKVTGADFYEVTVDTDPETKVSKIGSNSTSIPTDRLNDGQEYTVTITAYPVDKKKFKQSEPTVVKYTYNMKTIQLGSPGNIRQESSTDGKWIIAWDSVSHADYYYVSFDGGEEMQIHDTKIELVPTEMGIENGSTHNIQVRAGSDDSKYTTGEAGRASLKYEFKVPKFNVTLIFTLADGTEVGTPATYDMSMEAGNYSILSYIPAGYELADSTQTTFDVTTDTVKTVIVVRKAAEEEQPVQEPAAEEETNG